MRERHLTVEAALAGSVQQFDRSGLRPFLTVADLHSHTLTFGQLTQSAPIEGRGMNEDVLATTILRYETEPLFDIVPFDRTETFLCRSRSWPWRGGTRRRTRGLADHLSSTGVHLKTSATCGPFGPWLIRTFKRAPSGTVLWPAISNARAGRNASARLPP